MSVFSSMSDCNIEDIPNLENSLLSQAWYTFDANWFDLPRFVLSPTVNDLEFRFTDESFVTFYKKDTKSRKTGEWTFDGGNSLTTVVRHDGIVYRTKYEASFTEDGSISLHAVIPQKRRDDL